MPLIATYTFTKSLTLADLKQGMKVLITKPTNTSSGAGWAKEMDKFDGKVFTVKNSVYQYFYLVEDPDGFNFMPEWASLPAGPIISNTLSPVVAFPPVKIGEVQADCSCSTKDLLWFGHKCGRRAEIDKGTTLSKLIR